MHNYHLHSSKACVQTEIPTKKLRFGNAELVAINDPGCRVAGGYRRDRLRAIGLYVTAERWPRAAAHQPAVCGFGGAPSWSEYRSQWSLAKRGTVSKAGGLGFEPRLPSLFDQGYRSHSGCCWDFHSAAL
jgi:hypothetical protein